MYYKTITQEGGNTIKILLDDIHQWNVVAVRD